MKASTMFRNLTVAASGKRAASAANKHVRQVKQKPVFCPRTPVQHRLTALLESGPPIVVATGSAGSGKTFAATSIGVAKLASGEVDKMVVARPAVSCDEEHGFVPGTLTEKLLPWTKPVTDALLRYYTPAELKRLIEDEVVELCPLSHCRGRTFERSWIVLDEAQNCTRSQMLMMLTRIGSGSRIVVTGDTQQSDVGLDNGLADLLDRLEDADPLDFGIVAFGPGDVVRHPVIAKVLAAYANTD